MKLRASQIMNEIAQESNLLLEVDGEVREHIQQVLLSMLDDIVGCCKKNNIEYCLCGGSVLGAIRHKGFIPWDDDIDLFMMRQDWEHFKDIFSNALGEKYIMEAPNYDGRDCKTTFGKVFLKNSEMVEIQDINTPYTKGIFIDIFVIENVSENPLVRKFDAFIADFMKISATCKLYYDYPNSLMKQYMGKNWKTKAYFNTRRFWGFLLSWVSHRTWCMWYDKFVSRHKKATRLTTVPSGGKRYKGEMIERSIWCPFEQKEFCKRYVNVPHDWHKYLCNKYGLNYMQIPPENKRDKHFVVKIVFP